MSSQRKYRWIFILVSLLVGGGWLLYSLYTKPATCSAPPLQMPPLKAAEFASRAGAKGSFVGIQPSLEPRDYACAERFYQKLASYLDTAQRLGYLTATSVVVFPEYVGTWLVVEGEAERSIRAPTLAEAMVPFVLKAPWRFWQAYRAAAKQNLKDPAAAAIFQLKGAQMAQTYHRIFSQLAKSYQITLVAGSIVLPDPYVEGESLYVRPGGPLYNVSVVYRPDGRPEPALIRKAFPIAAELGFTQPGKVQAFPTFETPLGRLGVLICADSWFPESYTALKEVDLLAVPSYLMGDSCWAAPWRGYSGWPTPSDVTEKPLTEGEAWLTYAMAGRLPTHYPAATGLNVFLKGHFWELGADGRATILHQKQKHALEADLVCIWMQGK